MRVACIMLAGIVILLGGWRHANAQPSPRPVVKLATLEWPPYTGENLPHGGATVAVARKAFEAAGLELRIEFLPWARVIETARNDPSFDGYFPEYFAERLQQDYLLSHSVGDSPLGFMQRASAPVPWRTLPDLASQRIGVVKGYVNTRQFDELTAAGKLAVDPVVDDAANIRKVASGRINIAVIDQYVMRYLLTHNQELVHFFGRVEFQEQLLEEKELFVCFRKRPGAEALRARFNAGLATFDPKAVQTAAMSQIMQR